MQTDSLNLAIQVITIILLITLFVAVAFTVLWIKRIIYNITEKDRILLHKHKSYYMNTFESEIQKYLDRIGRENRLNFSFHARLLLVNPIIEYYGAEAYKIDNFHWQRSLSLIANTIREQPSENDHRDYDTGFINVTSFSVVKAFSINFCDIPPFCKPTR